MMELEEMMMMMIMVIWILCIEIDAYDRIKKGKWNKVNFVR